MSWFLSFGNEEVFLSLHLLDMTAIGALCWPEIARLETFLLARILIKCSWTFSCSWTMAVGPFEPWRVALGATWLGQ